MNLQKEILSAVVLHNTKLDNEQLALLVQEWQRQMSLRGIPEEIAAGALADISGKSRFMPKPIDVIERVQGDCNEQAVAAWDKVLKAFRHPDTPYRGVLFDDARISEAIQSLGGWVQFYEVIGQCIRNGEPWARKNFIEAYNSHRGLKPKALPGRESIKPLIVGDKRKALGLLPVVKKAYTIESNSIINKI